MGINGFGVDGDAWFLTFFLLKLVLTGADLCVVSDLLLTSRASVEEVAASPRWRGGATLSDRAFCTHHGVCDRPLEADPDPWAVHGHLAPLKETVFPFQGDARAPAWGPASPAG